MKDKSINAGSVLLSVLLAALLLSSCSQKQNPPLDSTPGVAAQPASWPVPTLPVAEPIADERIVLAAQRGLAALGYSVGVIDGIMGPATRQAILAFQKDRGLSQDGRLTQALTTLISNLAAQAPKIATTTILAGDVLLFGDGSKEVSKNSRVVSWDLASKRGLVAIRPSTAGWPQAAQAGLDWAISHALETSGSPISWSSTGVERQFEIVATSVLSARESALAGTNAQSCRHFELREGPRHYPAIVCREANGEWYFLRSQIRLAHPAKMVGSQTRTDLPRR